MIKTRDIRATEEILDLDLDHFRGVVRAHGLVGAEARLDHTIAGADPEKGHLADHDRRVLGDPELEVAIHQNEDVVLGAVVHRMQ